MIVVHGRSIASSREAYLGMYEVSGYRLLFVFDCPD